MSLPRSITALLIHGAADEVVPYQQSVGTAARLKEAGVPATLILIEGVRHSFIGLDVRANTRCVARALNATFDFLDATIGSLWDQSPQLPPWR